MEKRRGARPLPEKPSLENLKKQARTFLKQCRAGTREARDRAHAQLSRRDLDLEALTLSEAQLVIARENGFESWPRLKAHVERSSAGAIVALPLLPLRDRVLFPGAELFLTLAPSELELLGEGDRVFCVARRDAGAAGLAREDLFEIGTIAAIDLVRSRSGEALARLRGLDRARVTNLACSDGGPRVALKILPEPGISAEDRASAKARVLSRLDRFARGVEWLGQGELARVRKARSVRAVFGAIAVHLDLAARQRLLELDDPNEAVEHACLLLERVAGERPPRRQGSSPSRPLGARACLTVLYTSGHPHLLGRRFDLSERTTTLGRGSHNQVMLHGDSVSREHAVIEQEGSEYVLVDRSSTNGTFVCERAEPVVRHALNDGDRLLLGDAILLFSSGGDLDAKVRETIDYLARHDALTRLGNRQSFWSETHRQVLFARGDGQPLCTLVLEPDGLEQHAARLGPLTVNAALLHVAQVLRDKLPPLAVAGRLGDERFGVTLLGGDLTQALALGEVLRAEVAARRLDLFGETLSLTVSVGAAPLYDTTGTDELGEDALQALNRARAAGGNTVRGPLEAAA